MDKRVLIAGGILVVVVAAIGVAVMKQSKPPEARTEEPPLAQLRAERPKKSRSWVHPALKKIDRMEITSEGVTVKIRRTKAGDMRRDFGQWEVTSPFKYPADPFAVRQVLQRMTSLRFWEPFSKAKKDHSAAGVDSSGFRIVLWHGSQKMADVLLGKEIRAKLADRPLTYTYLREVGNDTVWKIKGSLKSLTRRKPSSWRDPKILKIKRNDIFEIGLVSASGSVVIARDPKEKDAKKRRIGWRIQTAEPPLDSLEQGDVSRMASTISYLRAKDFADKVKPTDAGLDKPRYTITLKTQSSKKGAKVQTYKLLIGKTITRKVKRGKREVDEKLVYIKTGSKPQVFLVQQMRLKNLMRSPSELRNRTLIHLGKGQQIVRLEVHKGKEKVVLAKEKLKWTALEPKDLKFTDSAVKRDVKMLATRFTAKSFSKERDPKKTGLEKPAGRLLVTIATTPAKASSKKGARAQQQPAARRSVVEIIVGKEAGKRERYLQVKGKPDIYIMRSYTLERVWKGVAKWKPPKRRPRGPGRVPGGFRMPSRRR